MRNNFAFSAFMLIFLSVIFSFKCGDGNNKNRIEVSGVIETTEINISSKVAGEIIKLNFDEGDLVKKTDTIAEIDRSNLEIQYKQALGGVQLAEAQLNLMLRGSREEDIKQSEENFRQAKANLESAESDKNRMESLFKSKTITVKQWEDIVTRYKVSLAQERSAEQFYQKMKRGSRIEDIDAARARKTQSDAQLDFIKKQRNDSYVISPATGVLSHKVFEVGELVNLGSNLFTISKMDKVFLMVYVNEQNLGIVKLGEKAEIKIDSHPDRIFEGKITYISSSAEFTPKNIQTKEDRTKLVYGVKIEIENPENILKPGMPADAWIIIK